jgi:biotin synthase
MSSQGLTGLGRAVLAGDVPDAAGWREVVRLGLADPWALLSEAWVVRRELFGQQVRFCAIVPGKLGACSEDCRWCAQSAGAWQGDGPQRTAPEEIHAAARQAQQDGARYIGIVNSGRSPSHADLQAALDGATAIGQNPDCSIGLCASLGMITVEQARELAAGGFARYHHNLETSRRFFPQVVSAHSYDEKLATLQAARVGGLAICCGGLFGLGEEWADRIDLALELRDTVRPDVVPLNFLVPLEGTALAGREPMAPMDILLTIALYRLILPRVDLKVAGGREANLRDLQSWIFHAGATSCMIGQYLTTAGRDAATDRQMVADLGFEPVDELACRA